MDRKIIILAPSGHTGELYRSAVNTCGIDADVVSTCQEMFDLMARNPYSGALLDFITKMKSSASEKRILEEISETFPMMIVKPSPEQGRIQAFSFSDIKNVGTIEGFIEKECLNSKPRIIKASEKKNLIFNVIVSDNPKFSGDNLERSVTVSVSAGGCFVFSINERDIDSTVWIVFREMTDKTPIKAIVKDVLPWGQKRRFPGFSLEFQSIKEGQLRDIWK
jgi:hypothetical protein